MLGKQKFSLINIYIESFRFNLERSANNWQDISQLIIGTKLFLAKNSILCLINQLLYIMIKTVGLSLELVNEQLN